MQSVACDGIVELSDFSSDALNKRVEDLLDAEHVQPSDQNGESWRMMFKLDEIGDPIGLVAHRP